MLVSGNTPEVRAACEDDIRARCERNFLPNYDDPNLGNWKPIRWSRIAGGTGPTDHDELLVRYGPLLLASDAPVRSSERRSLIVWDDFVADAAAHGWTLETGAVRSTTLPGILWTHTPACAMPGRRSECLFNALIASHYWSGRMERVLARPAFPAGSAGPPSAGWFVPPHLCAACASEFPLPWIDTPICAIPEHCEAGPVYGRLGSAAVELTGIFSESTRAALANPAITWLTPEGPKPDRPSDFLAAGINVELGFQVTRALADASGIFLVQEQRTPPQPVEPIEPSISQPGAAAYRRCEGPTHAVLRAADSSIFLLPSCGESATRIDSRNDVHVAIPLHGDELRMIESITVGPDGDLYVLDRADAAGVGDSRLLRLDAVDGALTALRHPALRFGAGRRDIIGGLDGQLYLIEAQHGDRTHISAFRFDSRHDRLVPVGATVVPGLSERKPQADDRGLSIAVVGRGGVRGSVGVLYSEVGGHGPRP